VAMPGACVNSYGSNLGPECEFFDKLYASDASECASFCAKRGSECKAWKTASSPNPPYPCELYKGDNCRGKVTAALEQAPSGPGICNVWKCATVKTECASLHLCQTELKEIGCSFRRRLRDRFRFKKTVDSSARDKSVEDSVAIKLDEAAEEELVGRRLGVFPQSRCHRLLVQCQKDLGVCREQQAQPFPKPVPFEDFIEETRRQAQQKSDNLQMRSSSLDELR